jgi:hypothetical protein
MKHCNQCHETKPEYHFYLSSAGKLSTYCKPCHRLNTGKWAKANKDRKNAINRNWRTNHHQRRTIMLRATNRLWSAIRTGLIIRATICQKCGGLQAIQTAHSDYSNPLDVRWLCIKCHRQWDADSPKTIP